MKELLIYFSVFAFGSVRWYYYRRRARVLDNQVYPEMDFKADDTLLTQYIPYYRKLSERGKQRFLYRLNKVRCSFEMKGRENFDANEEVKTLVAASITQLTYGFKNPVIPFLKGVAVFPDIFFSKLADHWVKGLTVGNGTVFLSWKDFLEGYAEAEDTYNLGLHEFAHVLRLEAQNRAFTDERLSEYFNQWEQIGQPDFLRIKTEENTFFRAYGGVNRSEFFSVCIENFFEVPQKFKQELPELYFHLCFLMKQDPLNIEEDYTFNRDDIEEANHLLDRGVPTYDIALSYTERIIWQGVGRLWALVWVILFCLMVNQPGLHWPFLSRLFIISPLLLVFWRWMYYRDLHAIVNKRYMAHLAFKLTPLLFIAVLFLHFLIS
jgi:Mlc titration factor MtfA (ptsG expression regulator)